MKCTVSKGWIGLLEVRSESVVTQCVETNGNNNRRAQAIKVHCRGKQREVV